MKDERTLSGQPMTLAEKRREALFTRLGPVKMQTIELLLDNDRRQVEKISQIQEQTANIAPLTKIVDSLSKRVEKPEKSCQSTRSGKTSTPSSKSNNG